MTEPRQIEFDTVGGTQAVEVFEPGGAPPVEGISSGPIIVVLPALGIEARYYGRFARSLQKCGIGTALLDNPGHGESPVRADSVSDWDYFDLHNHVCEAGRAIATEFPDHPLILLGHSLGGHLALMASPDIPNVDSTIIVASGRSYWRDWPGLTAYKMRALIEFCGGLARAYGYFPGDQVGFGGREAKTVMMQWASTTRTGAFQFGALDGDQLIARPGSPILGVRLEGDDWVPSASMRGLLAKASSRDVTFETWHGAPFGGDHNQWPAKPHWLVERIVNWCRERGLLDD
jgi:predicted alpha/beta hydrolase